MAEINQYILYGNFTEKHSDSLLKITKMRLSKDINFELMFIYVEENRLFLIDQLQSLPEKEWIVCSTIFKFGVLQLQLGIPNQKVKGLESFSSFNSYTGAPLFYGKLRKLLDSNLFINESEDIGLAYISPTLLIKKLEQFSLSTLLTTDTISKRLYTKLPSEKIKGLRETSKDVKSTVDRNRKETIIRFNPSEFDYSSLSDIQNICKRFDKNTDECTFEVEFIMDEDRGEFVFTPSVDALQLSGVQLMAKFFVHRLDDTEIEKGYQLLFETIARLPNIVSLDITFGVLYTETQEIDKSLLNDSFSNCQVAKVLESLTKLSVLRIFNVKMSWIPFFDCLKNISNLEELFLSNVNLITSLTSIHTTEYNQETFLDNFILSVPNLTRLGIQNSCVIDDEIYAIDAFLIALPRLPQLKSLDLSENDLYGDPESFRGAFTTNLQNVKQLKILNISHNNFDYEGENGDSEGFVDLCTILVELPNLEVLKMSYTEMNLGAIEILLPTLQTLKKLKILDISRNGDVEDEDVTMLRDELPKVNVLY
jgi:hypothetical protein